MANGHHKHIDQITPGDMVLAYNTDTQQWSNREVINQWSYLDTDQMATLTLTDGSQVSATDHHPFWVADSDAWVDAEDLQPGDNLLTPGGVTTVAEIDLWDSNPTLVWELTVATDHTFTVAAGEHDLLVHNNVCGLDLKVDPNTGSHILNGAIPSRDTIRNLNRADLVELKELLEISITNRRIDQRNGPFDQIDPGHTRRIADEESLLAFVNDLVG